MSQFDAQFEGVAIRGDRLNHKGKSWNIWECDATVDQGAAIAARVTATRVAIGTILAPGVGTIVGALAKKNRQKVYLALSVPADLVLVELDARKEGKARAFAQQVNRAAAHYKAQEEARLRSLED